MAIQELCTVTQAAQLAPGLFSLTLDAPRIAPLARAGQFLHLSCGEGNLLRRPISLCSVSTSDVRIVFQVKGEGTRWLSERKSGDAVDVLGPLGHGFDLAALGAKPVFLGGGIGVPPMLYAMRCAKAAGAQPAAILGFRSKSAVILEDEFDCPATVCTDDGSYGVHGFVTNVLQTQLADATGVAACGPKPMLKAIAALAASANVPCQVSMEERMGCGIGACLVCACALKSATGDTKYGHVCKDGPVFNAEEVSW